jgi:hypothetical protein
MKAHGKFLEDDCGRRPSMKRYYPEPHHPSVSLVCAKGFWGE